MKTKFKTVMSFLMIFALISTSCTIDDDNSPTDNSAQIENISNTAESGDWIITYFYDTDSEETSNYNGYTFTFENSGTLTASNGTNTYTGTWSVTDSNSNDDSNDDLDFNIVFTSPPNFEELSDDWEIISYTSSKIELTDVSGGNGGVDFLTFERN